jgi:hypothetical protein
MTESNLKSTLAAPDVAAAPGDCFSTIEAGEVVEACIKGSFDPDKTLKEVGVSSEGNCDVFRQCIVEQVDKAGCKIKKTDIPCDPDTLLRDVRAAVRDNSTPS